MGQFPIDDIQRQTRTAAATQPGSIRPMSVAVFDFFSGF
jgi:hypothetical protein